MTADSLLNVEGGVITTVTLNRPEVRNAFNDQVVEQLTTVFTDLGHSDAVRVIVLSGTGKCFSAGADVNWMRSMIDYTYEENVADARAMAGMFDAIARCPKPVIARVHGAAIGGGCGLVAATDIAVADTETVFAFSEVRLGIIPAVISPYVLSRIGRRYARQYFLTGERFDATVAREMGLVDHVTIGDDLDAHINRLCGEILKCPVGAVAKAKQLIEDVCGPPATNNQTELTAQAIAERRASDEGQEGMRAFLEKRKPKWLQEDGGGSP